MVSVLKRCREASLPWSVFLTQGSDTVRSGRKKCKRGERPLCWRERARDTEPTCRVRRRAADLVGCSRAFVTRPHSHVAWAMHVRQTERRIDSNGFVLRESLARSAQRFADISTPLPERHSCDIRRCRPEKGGLLCFRVEACRIALSSSLRRPFFLE